MIWIRKKGKGRSIERPFLFFSFVEHARLELATS